MEFFVCVVFRFKSSQWGQWRSSPGLVIREGSLGLVRNPFSSIRNTITVHASWCLRSISPCGLHLIWKNCNSWWILLHFWPQIWIYLLGAEEGNLEIVASLVSIQYIMGDIYSKRTWNSVCYHTCTGIIHIKQNKSFKACNGGSQS